jgi:hypothetical protein
MPNALRGLMMRYRAQCCTLDAWEGAAVFGTVSSSVPDVLRVCLNWRAHQDLHPEPHLLEAGHARVCYTLRACEMNGLPHMDLHHNDRLNRPAGYFTSQGIVEIGGRDG